MAVYGDDQCICCGALRVAKSYYCAECLVKLCEIRRVEIERLEREKLLLHDKLQQALRLGERLLDHISSEAVYMSELRLVLWKAKGIITSKG